MQLSWLERMTHNREVKSSSLFIATIYCKTSSIKNANHSMIGFFLPDFCQVASSSAALSSFSVSKIFCILIAADCRHVSCNILLIKSPYFTVENCQNTLTCLRVLITDQLSQSVVISAMSFCLRYDNFFTYYNDIGVLADTVI